MLFVIITIIVVILVIMGAHKNKIDTNIDEGTINGEDKSKDKKSQSSSKGQILSKQSDLSKPNSSQNKGVQVALYAGSLLILAGIGGLVWSGLDIVGLVLLVLAMIAFFVVGILVRKSESYAIVSQAFVGTGMAILPFVGILIWNITKIDPRIIWLSLSAIGAPLFIYVTYLMNNKIFSYFAIAGLVSFSCSMSAIMGLELAWYFIMVMVLGVILDIISMLKITKKFGAMQFAVRTAGEWLPMVAFGASLYAIALISEIEYAIMLAVIALQFSLNLWHQHKLFWEICLRFTCLGLIISISHIFIPTPQGIGVGLIIGATVELCYSFIKTVFGKNQNSDRLVAEMGWILLSMILFPIAGLFISLFVAPGIWISLVVTLPIDLAIMIIARFMFERREWYFAFLAIGIMLPIAILNLIGLSHVEMVPILKATYIICMFVMEGLGWLTKGKSGDAMFLSGVVVFGLATVIVEASILMATLILSIALCSWGSIKKRSEYLEASIYTFAIAMIIMISQNLMDSQSIFASVLITHTIAGSLIIASLIWERENHTRLFAGCVVLLAIIGGIALSGELWVMILFMIEATIVLICGLILKMRYLWITGAVALFLSVMWFTKDIPFVLPVILGLGLIGSSIGVIAYNNKKAKISNKTPSKKS